MGGDVAAETELITSTFEQDVKQVVHLLTVDAVLLLGIRRKGTEVSPACTLSLCHKAMLRKSRNCSYINRLILTQSAQT